MPTHLFTHLILQLLSKCTRYHELISRGHEYIKAPKIETDGLQDEQDRTIAQQIISQRYQTIITIVLPEEFCGAEEVSDLQLTISK